MQNPGPPGNAVVGSEVGRACSFSKGASVASSSSSMLACRAAGRLAAAFGRGSQLRTALAGNRARPVVSDLCANGGSPYVPAAWPPLPRDKSTVSFPPPPVTTSEEQPVWTDQVWASPLDIRRRVFCNRSLNMKNIKAVGFDMDYTLAQYRPETFETLAHEQTVDKLVRYFGYPESLYDLTFDHGYMCRGLVIDKKRGNMLKIDRHKYVKLAFHGFRALPREQRMSVYNNADKREEYDEPAFALIDTLFSLAEAYLFMQASSGAACRSAGLARAAVDVRGAVDLCHRDGSIKREVAANPEKYIHDDPGLVPLLEMLRQSGKQIFVATNSMWDYTHVVMNWVISRRKGAERSEDWLKLFDAVVVGCGKPRYFTERSNLFEVHTGTGMLWNTEGGSPMIPIGEEDLPTPILHQPGARARVFQGGYYLDLHKMLDAIGWRTLLVIPELDAELEVLAGCKNNMQELRVLRKQRDALDDQIQRLEWQLSNAPLDGDPSHNMDLSAAGTSSEDELNAFADMLSNLKQQRESLRERHRDLLRSHHEQFHPWGQLMKTGYQNSRYAHQMERFACLYTSHVSNLIFYSPLKSWRGKPDVMIHEDELMG
ncbi:hypothetical protein CHLNCDRAFT_30799 [Chlorella variabilis]|uniref:5'-nucleotidase n=1 Tax=Chlorella variabilis TaxID=554065 RepID=E1ZD99_CHLVA|nr:hypothetical protein CHLNCDRAFT_30799 [Chlorella variabilis]EFN56183.1 hypothetical protein CHLNCDRAFT_30799 [Chlorella variabilis]|eukprot:XP_005848285.1 hypothetical protein CHLNCDRAFT_30799 [Chlorella variabilis]